MRFTTAALRRAVAATALLTPVVFAQTSTDCNPMSKTCPNDPALGTSHTFDFVNSNSTVTAEAWNVTAGTVTYGTNGAEFTVAKQGDSPTIKSQFYIFFGSVSVVMQAAPGQGIVSSIVLESDDLDEVDWEWMGGNNTSAETNYFGKGNTTTYDRAIYYPVSNPTGSFHNYTVDWTAERLQWWIDGNLVRTLAYADANGGYDYPQTPCTIRLGIWAGGDPTLSKGTIEWAGGLTDFTKGPYTMYIKSTTIKDYSTGSEYEWSDQSGSWQSIKVIAGSSKVNETLTAAANGTLDLSKTTPSSSSSDSSSSSSSSGSSSSSSSSSSASSTSTSTSSESLGSKFSSLSPTTKTAVYGGSAAAAAILISALAFVCFRQRRAGRKEREAYNAKIEKEREDAYRDQMELRDKGLGGFSATNNLGEDSLGGWAGNRQDLEREREGLVSSTPAVPRWNGGNEGGLINGAGNAYSGAFGGNVRNGPPSPGLDFHQPQPQHEGPLSPGGFDFGQPSGWSQPGPDMGHSQNQGGNYHRF